MTADWYVLETVDGFGAHLNSYDALKMRLDAKIICVKEEGDNSRVNQVHDKSVAKSDKHEHRLTLGMLRKMQGANNIFNQWQIWCIVVYRQFLPRPLTQTFGLVLAVNG